MLGHSQGGFSLYPPQHKGDSPHKLTLLRPNPDLGVGISCFLSISCAFQPEIHAFHAKMRESATSKQHLPSSLSMCKKYVGYMPRSTPFLSRVMRHLIVTPWGAGRYTKSSRSSVGSGVLPRAPAFRSYKSYTITFKNIRIIRDYWCLHHYDIIM